MKLRLRYQTTTKVLNIPEEVQSFYTLADVRSAAFELFEGLLSGFSPFQFSLNKKDVLEDETKTLCDYKIVSGDLVFIISNEDCHSSQPTDSASMVSVDTKSDPSMEGVKSSSCVKFSDDTNDVVMASSSSRTDSEMVQSTNNNADEDVGTSSSSRAGEQFFSEPHLCREVTGAEVPALLREVYSSLQPADKVDALCVVLHVLMLETGYKVKLETAGASDSDRSFSSDVPEVWKFPGRAMFLYTYPGCANCLCSLTLIPLGGQVICHGKVSGDDNTQTYKITLKPEEFVDTVKSDPVGVFVNLIKLSMDFKNAVALPLLQDLRTYAGVPQPFGLMALTLELRILGFLDVRSILSLSEVNRDMLTLSKDSYLWRRLYLRDFGSTGHTDRHLLQDWRKLYITSYKAAKERQKRSQQRVLMPGGMDPFQHPFPAPWIPPVPRMIGGDYDLNPNLPGVFPDDPLRLGGRVPRPRIDLIGPNPDQDPLRRPGMFGPGRRGGRGSSFGGGFGPGFF